MSDKKFIPKVGENCICTVLSGNPIIKPKYVGSAHVLFDYDGGEFSILHRHFIPYKTTDEIEREATVREMRDYISHDYDTGNKIAERLYNAGFHNQPKVKPLSELEFIRLYFDESARSLYKLLTPYIIQGGK